MPLQFIDIKDSNVKFVNEEKDPNLLLQAENTELKLALAELAEAQELEKLNTQLALAELAEMMTGGAE